MCNAFKCAVYLAVCCSCFIGLSAEEEQPLQLKNCTSQGECPDHSICTKVGANLNCICWQGYHQNPDWAPEVFDSDDSDYCGREPSNKTIVIHNRLPVNRESLAIAIVLVLTGVIVVTLVLYCAVVLRPINRTQAVYRRLQLRRSNHRRLEEFNDIDMTFPNTRTVE